MSNWRILEANPTEQNDRGSPGSQAREKSPAGLLLRAKNTKCGLTSTFKGGCLEEAERKSIEGYSMDFLSVYFLY